MRLGPALANLPLVTAGSGVAIGLPQNFGIQATGVSASQAATLPAAKGWQAVVSGSCSQATNAQVAAWQASGRPHRALNLAAVLGSDAQQPCRSAKRSVVGKTLVAATARTDLLNRRC